MSGVKHKRKGSRIEREIVELLADIAIEAERVPLSGAAHYKGGGHDVDVYPFGRDEGAFVFEVKGRKSGDGFRMLDRWLGTNHGLFLKRDRRKPLVVLSWESLEALLIAANRAWQRGFSREQRDAIFARHAASGETRGDSYATTQILPTRPRALLPARPLSQVPLNGDAPRKAKRVAAGQART